MYRLLCAGIYLIILTVSPVSRADDEYTERDKRDASDIQLTGTWTVVTIEHAPYYQKGKYGRYEGFIPDLLRLMRFRLRVEFHIRLIEDKKYGTYDNSTATWTGLMGAITKPKGTPGSADLAAAPLTITAKRQDAVNFVKPFYNLGLTMLVKKSYLQPQEHAMGFAFNIISPLSPSVWALCTLSMVVVALVLWLMNRFNPYEWGGRYNLGRATEAQAEAFNITGAFWFTFTTLQWQGYERNPRSIASKVLACFWFCFITITLVTYTGSLVNHLFWASTVHGKDPVAPPIVDLEHLVMGTSGFKYGTITGGSTYTYFRNARGAEFEKMREYFDSDEGQENLVSSFEDGFKKAREGKYAFLCESLIAKHEMHKLPCDLTTAGGVFGQRSYGFALPKWANQDTMDAFHRVILELQEEGEIDALEKKWWVDKGECYNVSQAEKQISRLTAIYVNKPKQVDLDMFWGPLTLLLIGIVASILVAVGEIMYYKYKGRYHDRNRPVGQQLKLDEDGNI